MDCFAPGWKWWFCDWAASQKGTECMPVMCTGPCCYWANPLGFAWLSLLEIQWHPPPSVLHLNPVIYNHTNQPFIKQLSAFLSLDRYSIKILIPSESRGLKFNIPSFTPERGFFQVAPLRLKSDICGWEAEKSKTSCWANQYLLIGIKEYWSPTRFLSFSPLHFPR